MARILERLKSLFRDRRTHTEPVSVERRARPSRKEIDDRLRSAVADLEQTVRLKREYFTKFSANDVQQTVQFETYRAICRFTLKAGQFRLCKHHQHEAANTGMAKCDEKLCPVMLGKTA